MIVTIIGNGFDRKLGLKTDYLSFLAWMKSEGYGVGKKFSLFSNNILTNHNEENLKNRLQTYQINKSNIDFFGGNFEYKNLNNSNIFDKVEETKIANSIIYLLPEILENKLKNKTENSNIWYCFIQLLIYEKKHKIFNLNLENFLKFIGDEGNWVDIEGLIQRCIELRTMESYYSNGYFSLSRYFDIFSFANFLVTVNNSNIQLSREDVYNYVWKDFLEFKILLVSYLELQTENLDFFKLYEEKRIDFRNSIKEKNIEFFHIQPTDTNIIINFNYTNLFQNKNNVVYNLHGNILDKDKIVFGLDFNIKNAAFDKSERKSEFETKLYKIKSLLNFSKTYQLLNLQIDKESPNFQKVDKLYILGHSIGEQDYSYYFSLIDSNSNNISITCFWYEFDNLKNNKESTIEAFFEMILQYERYSNLKIFHKMIFEGRLKIKQVFIPKIFN